METPLNILYLEDEPAMVELVHGMLEAEGLLCEITNTDTRDGFTKALENSFHLIFADYSLPQFDGLSALAIVQEKTPDIPFIFISGRMGEEVAIESLKNGATDYVLKQNLTRLVPTVKRALKELEVKKRTKALEQKLQHMAYYDALTGLPNRSLLEERIEQCIKRMNRDKNYIFCVVFLDLDRFKQVNDSFGHYIGDELLIAVANQLTRLVRQGDTVARMGGDEFGILLDNIHDVSDVSKFTHRILEKFELPLHLKGRELYTSPSIGVALSTQEHDSSEAIIRDADIAMYMAKDEGRGCCRFYDPSIRDKIIENLQLETDLKQALEQQQLELFYQPIVLLETGEITGFEALIRWNHPKQGLLLPEKFISIAEETGSIIPIGKWVLEEACSQIKAWNDEFTRQTPLFICVNVSARQVSSSFPDEVENILRQTQLSPDALRLEITESTIVERYQELSRIFDVLKKKSVHVALDDFGTGYSSLSHLNHFPIDVLKIDRGFINQMDNNEKDIQIVKATHALAESLGIVVVAEGIETKKQLNKLKSIHCMFGQGFLFCKPVNKTKARELLLKGKHW